MSHNDFAIGRADFTIDFWVRFNSVSSQQNLVDFRTGSNQGPYPVIYFNNADAFFHYYVQSAIRIDSTTTIVVNTWYHVAVTRSSGNTRLFVNGTQEGSTYVDSNDYTVDSSRPNFGAGSDGTANLNGWIDELRVRIGEAVWTSNFTPPAAPYSEVLLLHANGADASTTITDSSPQPKTVTANGNAQIDTAQFKFGSASALFDGTGDYLTAAAAIAENPDFRFGTGDFTIDCWVRFSDVTTHSSIVYSSGWTGTVGVNVYLSSGAQQFTVYNGTDIVITGASGRTTGVWYHVAVTRSGTSMKLFVNGVQDGSTYTSTENFIVAVGFPQVGARDAGSDSAFAWIDEFRILKGKAAWTSNFAVPSHEYHMAAVARERLLLHGDGVDGSTTITDSSYWARNAVAVGNAQVDTAQKKFGTASMLFDGTGDYVLVGDREDFEIGNSDFTIDFWFRINSGTSEKGLVSFKDQTDNSGQIEFWLTAASKLSVYFGPEGLFTGTTTIVTGVWYHAACTRSGSSIRMFLNGIQEAGTVTDSRYVSCGEHGVVVGVDGFALINYLNGWIDELRIVVGTAHWTSNFLPWPSAYDAPANVLLLHANGADATRAFPDNNDIPRAHRITVNGDTRIDTAQSKFGGSSILFDGTGDYLRCDGSSDFAFGTGDFTIDFWVRFNSLTPTETNLIDFRDSAGIAEPILIYSDSNDKIKVWANSADRITGTTTVTTATWYHVAVTRASGSTKLFINGTQEGSTYTDSNNYRIGASGPAMGADNATPGANPLNGWLDEIRIKRGEAAWTSNFTAPSAAYNPSDGHLLIHGDGPNANVLMIADVGTAAGKTDIIVNADAQVDTAQQKFGTASALFDGTGDYLNVA